MAYAVIVDGVTFPACTGVRTVVVAAHLSATTHIRVLFTLVHVILTLTSGPAAATDTASGRVTIQTTPITHTGQPTLGAVAETGARRARALIGVELEAAVTGAGEAAVRVFTRLSAQTVFTLVVVHARLVVCRVKVVTRVAEAQRDQGVGGGILHSPAALTATAVCTNGLDLTGLNTAHSVDESVAVFTQTLVAPFSVVADLLTVVRLLGALVDVSTGAEIAGEPEASGAGTLVAACCVVASRLTVVQLLVLTLVNVQTKIHLT